MKKKIIPLHDNILIELNVKEATAGGIVLPSGSEDVKTGSIVAIGTGVPKELVDDGSKQAPCRNSRGLKIGDKVFLPRGDKVGDKFQDDGKQYLNTKITNISAIIEGSQ